MVCLITSKINFPRFEDMDTNDEEYELVIGSGIIWDKLLASSL